MKILVTGGTGVIGDGVIPALIDAGHSIRLVTRGADKAVREWPAQVQAFAADLGKPNTVKGAADGCEAVVHIAGIVDDSAPGVTFEQTNVLGTKNILAEAERAGVCRFIFISSLGAERGASDYHKSKRVAEEAVRKFKGDWLILRPGNVYGPGDEVISLLLKLVRTLPAVPVIDDGEQKFQPIWYRDLGKAIALAVEPSAVSHQTLEIAGAEVTTMNDLLDRLTRITGKRPARIPVPSFLASVGIQLGEIGGIGKKIGELLGVEAPINDAKLKMLMEENFIRAPQSNALIATFKLKPLPLDEGLALLADALPEQLPSEGVGALNHKKFWADIVGSRHTAAALLEAFRQKFSQIMPLDFSPEPGTPQAVREGATLTAAIPARGTIQIRVIESNGERLTFATLEGHPLAGIVRFSGRSYSGGRIRFAVEIYARAANAFDLIAMRTLGESMQDSNWQQVVERTVQISGGRAPKGVQSLSESVSEARAKKLEKEIETLVMQHRRVTNRQGSSSHTKHAKRSRLKATAQRSGHGSTKSRAD